MVKIDKLVKIRDQALSVFKGLSDQLPGVSVKTGAMAGDGFVCKLTARGARSELHCRVLREAPPNLVRAAALDLCFSIQSGSRGQVPMLFAPFFSAQSQSVCRELGVGYVDCLGNAWLAVENCLIVSHAASKPAAVKRELRSLFKPKSAQVLKQLLAQPEKHWRLAELAQASEASLGLVGKVKQGLLDREWAQFSRQGLLLSAPDALLDQWQANYQPVVGKRLIFYTTLHGVALENRLRSSIESTPESALICLASFSAAQWIAPYARTGNHYLYVNEFGLEHLVTSLGLTPSSGGGVFVTLVDDRDLFRDTFVALDGMRCTGAVQTYLDLSVSGERGQEAALFLRQKVLDGNTGYRSGTVPE